MPCYEIKDYSIELLDSIKSSPGHYTIRLSPLESKKILHTYGFYYCDSLLEISCNKNSFNCFEQPPDLDLKLDEVSDEKILFKRSKNLFYFDRFHRDFNLTNIDSDHRYEKWLSKIIASGTIYSCLLNNEVVGYIALEKNRFLLHAIFKDYQGKGLSKFFWSLACKQVFDAGYDEIQSSVSSTNLPVLNLYSTLGFQFKSAVDIYHLTISKVS